MTIGPASTNHHPFCDEAIIAPKLLLAWSLTVVLGSAIVLTLDGWQTGFLATQSVTTHFPSWLWSSLTVLGDERMLLALMLPFGLRFPKTFWAVIVASLLTALTVRLTKAAIPMPRPADLLGSAHVTLIGAARSGHSFPSSHAATVFTFAGVWAIRLGWKTALPMLALAALASLSRVAVGVHWPIDVLAGIVIGLLCAWLGLILARRLRWGTRPEVHWALAATAAVAVASLPFDAQGYPDSIVFRVLLCTFGLAGFWIHYLRPLWHQGWAACRKTPQI